MRTRQIGMTVVVVVVVLLLLLLQATSAQEQQGPEYGSEVPLTALSEPACKDVYDLTVRDALVRLNYDRVQRDAGGKTSGLTSYAYLVRQDEAGAERTLIVGLKTYATQDSRIYLWGSVPQEGESAPNPDVAALAAVVAQAVGDQQKSPRTFAIHELSHETYRLGCIDVDSCIKILAQFGYNTKPPSGQVDISKLPAVFKVDQKAPESVVGKKVPAKETLSAPLYRLMILYHSSQSEEVGRLKDLLRETIDAPASQVLIEAMVIELTEDTTREMGVQWNVFKHAGRWATFEPEGEQTPLTLFYNPKLHPEDFTRVVESTIRMILEEGKAEVLSRPSVLVLNNQSAMIQVVRDTPIVKQTITRDFAKIEVTFKPVGITLNIMPRVSEDGSTIAMQILTEVSEIPEGEWIVIPEGYMAGTRVAPAIDRRVVQTVARVQDNTPFIIGGLIRNEKGGTVRGIPVLSRIPILGVLFQWRSSRWGKREVIIVLTPRVLRPTGTHRPVLPKDTARFDFLGNRLFRNSYRLKGEDVFDLGFLESNPSILQTMARTRAFVRSRPEYAKQSPFKELAAGIIPGEDAVVIRMIYEIAKDKLALHEQIKTENLIFFGRNPDKAPGFDVSWLQRTLEEASPRGSVESYLRRPYPKKVLFFRYKRDPEGGLGEALKTPVAELEWREVQSRDEVEQALLEINRLHEDYSYHEFAFVMDNEKDLTRLKVAIALREIVNVNNLEDLLTIRYFRVGRRIAIPELIRPDGRTFLIDHKVAELFFKSDYYYSALRAKLERAYEIVEQALAVEGY